MPYITDLDEVDKGKLWDKTMIDLQNLTKENGYSSYFIQSLTKSDEESKKWNLEKGF